MQVATHLIDDTIPDVRQVPVPPDAELEMARSVRLLGVLQPVLLRPQGNRYEIALGRRRLRAAIAAGLNEIPAEVREMTDAEALDAQLTENRLRQEMHPIDLWRNARKLIEDGMDPGRAAIVLGVDDRGAKQMARLGKLHPDLLKAIEHCDEFPDAGELRRIANASPKAQAAALKVARQGGRDGWVNWRMVADRCKCNTISRAHAIFDLEKSKIVWDEDLFAEPNSDDQFTTSNVEQFMKAQRVALEAQVAEAQAKKKRVRLAEFDQHGHLVVPKGWKEIWSGNVEEPKAHEHVFLGIGADGQIKKRLVLDAPSEKAAQKAADKRAKVNAALARSADADPSERPAAATATGAAETADDAAEAPEEAAGRGPLTKAGLTVVAAAKTEALRKALADGSGEPVLMLALTILAFTANNVDIRGIHRADHRHHPDDLVAKLLLPGGELTPRLEAREVCAIAAELLGRFLTVGGPDAARHSYSPSSGDAAEWIGRALEADALLPRFDTEDFLKHVAGSELKRLAGELCIRTTMKLDALRSALVGNAPNWRPAAAQFGAAALHEVIAGERICDVTDQDLSFDQDPGTRQ